MLTVTVTDLLPGHEASIAPDVANSPPGASEAVQTPAPALPRPMSPQRLPLAGLVAPDESDPALVGDSWRSPPEILDLARDFCLMARLGGRIALDPCTGPGSLVDARVEIALPRDGLAEDWAALADGGLIWCNPPYSDPGPWVRMAANAGRDGAHVVMLVNAMTSDGWWVWPRAACFWRGRIRFVSPDGKRHMTNQHPSALLYFGPSPELFEWSFKENGKVVRS